MSTQFGQLSRKNEAGSWRRHLQWMASWVEGLCEPRPQGVVADSRWRLADGEDLSTGSGACVTIGSMYRRPTHSGALPALLHTGLDGALANSQISLSFHFLVCKS